ncbi:hypothetical protein B0T25DRAFT_549234 [Lasiosphaeria hispida]|uniref:F-box domain-containing protein n=1 Tax=Lasiosphaeria hispida TaxID=260671 RepID=A0AAJ0HFJ9_9PEZI|nr:hypothetical protein B0T25DRAFT_549234 [Lasiosphaeria hispida]
MKQTLSDLPDDVLRLILANLESARDLWALALSCYRLHRFVDDDGWRVFVRTRFRSLSIPIPRSQSESGKEVDTSEKASSSSSDGSKSRPQKGRPSYRELAESLTWQSRCWDRRALRFQALQPGAKPRERGAPPPRHPRGSRFQPVVDAYLDPDTREEMVIWGAGEDVVARYRQPGATATTEVTWAGSDGKDFGFKAGYDDVRALSIVKGQARYDGCRSFLTGRDNGELALLSAEPVRFGERLVQFRPAPAVVDGEEVDEDAEESVEQETINSLDVLRDGPKNLIAAATKSSVLVYGLPEDDAAEANPLTIYDLRRDIFPSGTQLCRATWMGQGETIALALRGCNDPLRYLSITPTGWTHHTAAKNANIEQKFDITYGNVCPNSLQPVRPHASSKGGPSLLLSAWRDGTCRLQDLRTPSAFDAVYQDNIDPWSDSEVLMTYGTERFISGGMNGETIKIFDFRWTKDYYHTSGLSCLGATPFPEPPQPFQKRPPGSDWTTPTASRRALCDHMAGLSCRWHEFSRDIYFRPNVSFFLSKALPDRGPNTGVGGVWSLAKASDYSPNFYVGITGGILEANLQPFNPDFERIAPISRTSRAFGDWRRSNGRVSTPTDSVEEISGGVDKLSLTLAPTETAKTGPVILCDPNFGFADWRDSGAVGRGYESTPVAASMMETGDGEACKSNDRAIQLPRLMHPGQAWHESGAGVADFPDEYASLPRENTKYHRLDRHYHNA